MINKYDKLRGVYIMLLKKWCPYNHPFFFPHFVPTCINQSYNIKKLKSLKIDKNIAPQAAVVVRNKKTRYFSQLTRNKKTYYAKTAKNQVIIVNSLISANFTSKPQQMMVSIILFSCMSFLIFLFKKLVPLEKENRPMQ